MLDVDPNLFPRLLASLDAMLQEFRFDAEALDPSVGAAAVANQTALWPDRGLKERRNIDRVLLKTVTAAAIQELPEFHLIGTFYYPPGGYVGWHTDAERPGERIYFSWSHNGDSYFATFHEGGLIEHYDPPQKWTVKQFATSRENVFPHAVRSITAHRISVGFRRPSCT